MQFIEINQNFGEQTEFLYLFIITALIVWLTLAIFSLKKYGIKKTTRYFLPMIVAALVIESAGVAAGRYYYPGYFLYLSAVGGGVPLIIVLAWSANLVLFLNMGKQVVLRFYKKRNISQIVIVSAMAGLFAVCLDLLEDPLAHHNNWWIWKESLTGIKFYGVPFINFVGWFILIFYMSLATLLIERSDYSENRKLLISVFSISITGVAIFVTQGLLLRLSQIIGLA